MEARTVVDTIMVMADGNEHHLKVGQAPGGGSSYHIYIDDIYCGGFILYNIGWTPKVEKMAVYLLTADDIDAILDMVEGRLKPVISNKKGS